jgi:alanine dehydrogenase
MKIGVPREIKPQENRIGLTPESVKTLTSDGHEVLVENNGGFEAGFDNDQYKSAGAKIIDKAEDIFNDAEIIVKVKEPLSNEVKMIRENQIIFTYLHLAAAKELTQGLIDSKSVCIAYETVTDNNGRLPLLAPMSAVAGRMSVQAGAHCLEKNQKGRGLLLGGAPGVEPGNVVILGGGVVGENAAIIATGKESKSPYCFNLASDLSTIWTFACIPVAIIAAFSPTTPPPNITTLPGSTPGAPPSNNPLPFWFFSKQCAPA